MEPWIGEIRLFGGLFEPRDWAFCDGRSMQITRYTALFSLLGTTYGGDGRTYFNLPDLRSRVPVHHGSAAGVDTYALGETAGVEAVTLLTSELPAHTHPMSVASNEATSRSAVGSLPAAVSSDPPYGTGVDDHRGFTSQAGGSQPHTNLQPFVGMNYIIALAGTFPQRP